MWNWLTAWRRLKPTPQRLLLIAPDTFANQVRRAIDERSTGTVAVISSTPTENQNVQGFDPVLLLSLTLAVYSAIFRPLGDVLAEAFKAHRGYTIELKTRNVRRRFCFPQSTSDKDIEAAVDLLIAELERNPDVRTST